jgi:cytochrome o ubiquinol oxidase operon protein cyoD
MSAPADTSAGRGPGPDNKANHLPLDAHGHGPAHSDSAHHGHEEDAAAHGGSMKDYVTGFVLAVILTAIPFWLVMGKVFQSSTVTAVVILAIAAVQIVVHMIYFLHMNTESEGGWSLLALIFTIMLVVITLSGSLWVMYHLNANMMPMSMHDMKNMP